jgi:small subunit ribosomal protein S21
LIREPPSVAKRLAQLGMSCRNHEDRSRIWHSSPVNAQHGKAQGLMQVFVRDNNVDQALRVLKKKMQREGTFRELKRRRSYEKPSERRNREKADAVRRYRKTLRKRLEREGY